MNAHQLPAMIATFAAVTSLGVVIGCS